MQGIGASAKVGDVRVLATSGRGATPEEWVELTLAQFISISDQAPEPVRQQVYAYRENIRILLIAAMKNAIQSDRTTIIHFLNKAGRSDLASAVRSL